MNILGNEPKNGVNLQMGSLKRNILEINKLTVPSIAPDSCEQPESPAQRNTPDNSRTKCCRHLLQ